MSAENSKFLFVDFLEHRALVEFGGPLQIAQQVFLGRVEDFDLNMVLVSLRSSRYLRPRQVPSSFWKAGWCITSLS